jgi:hypothetical protein
MTGGKGRKEGMTSGERAEERMRRVDGERTRKGLRALGPSLEVGGELRLVTDTR